ncbi:HamA C-terminal domain-containing protein [Bathymodiolus septemdierum thioautotrophic gill symbiont]|uniref:Anti-bacteriophage protein A/HamA C-terminal domain-containing protein n=1 Tax=endosymbiont of Bathymodiolus septemdierum str. Myojin knoll TaxID=1303921 RepID=A0A0P0US89_9GAMM|nr:DUF1837 domain-containing protein [Bathymodiolus septemdierum thioautotrophic gill symbiont]BAS68152.1 conserved hypothetical protein [endosymbiont of Bathymodiolus septemdierum str. Myojin knoll]
MVNFEKLIDTSFVDISINPALLSIDKKHVLSLINDFESGKWRYDKFQNYIWDNIAETALSKNERDKLIEKPNSALIESAKKLRITSNDTIGKGSELCEILLYGIMKDYYSALPIVPKIFYKQNSQDNAKGADSVHIVIEDKGNDFSLWFGEAKFYKNIDGAIDSAIGSVDNFLRNDNQIKKENSIITSVSDIDNMGLSSELVEKIKSTLSGENSLDNIKPKINIPILLLHECDITKKENELTEEYKNKMISSHKKKANKYFKKQVKVMSNIFKYSNIKFHLILFPIPNKRDIVDRFISNAEYYRAP